MSKRRWLFVALATLMVGALVVPALASGPASAAGVSPVELSGNRDCTAVGVKGTDFKDEYKLEPISGDGNFGPIALAPGVTLAGKIYDNKKKFDFTITGAVIVDVLVKGGANTNHYDYVETIGAVTADQALHAPMRNRTQSYELSHVSFCWDDRIALSGTKFLDENANGTRDDLLAADEGGIEGWNITAHRDGVQVAQTVTDADGDYTFLLAPGTYLICEEARVDFAQTTPENQLCSGIQGAAPGGHSVELTTTSSGNDFGNVATITLVCGGDPVTTGGGEDPQGTIRLDGCEGGKTAVYRSGFDNVAGYQFIQFEPLGDSDEGYFLELVTWQPVEADTPNDLELRYFPGLPEGDPQPMQFCERDPRGDEVVDPQAVLPAGETWCVIEVNYVVLDSGLIGAVHDLFGRGDPTRTFN